MTLKCKKVKCSECEGSPPSDNDKIVTNQAEADALPAVVDGNLFVTNITNASIALPCEKVKGSVFVSGIVVNNGAHAVNFTHLNRVGCDLVVGRDTISPNSDHVNDVSQPGSRLSVLFPVLKTVAGDVVLGMNMRPGTLGFRFLGNYVHDDGHQLIEFSALEKVCKNVIVGTLGNAGDSGNAIQNRGNQDVKMNGAFYIKRNLVIGLFNESATPLCDSYGNSVAGQANQPILIACKAVNGKLVHGILGEGARGNFISARGAQIVDLPMLQNVKDHALFGDLRGTLACIGGVYGNLVTFGSIAKVSLPRLEKLSGFLTVGTYETSSNGNAAVELSTYEVDLSALRQVHKDVTLGSETSTSSGIPNDVLVNSVIKVDLRNLRHVKGRLNVNLNKSTPTSQQNSIIEFVLDSLCSVGKEFSFSKNTNVNFTSLHWDDSRPLRCIGGPLNILGNLTNGPRALTDLNGLSSLACLSKTKSVVVTNNAALTGYCGLYQLATDASISFTISGNPSNPTKAQIADNGPCLDAERLQPRESCFAPICCPPNATVKCTGSIDPIITGYPSSTDPAAVFVYVDTVVTAPGDDCSACIVRREWSDSRCCTDKPCAQLIVVKCRCGPHVECPPDVTLESGDPYTPAFTGTATCECRTSPACQCLQNKLCSGGVDSDEEEESGEGGQEQPEENCIVTYSDKTVSKFACENGAPKHIRRSWTCTDACGRKSTCVQNIYFRRADRFPLC